MSQVVPLLDNIDLSLATIYIIYALDARPLIRRIVDVMRHDSPARAIALRSLESSEELPLARDAKTRSALIRCDVVVFCVSPQAITYAAPTSDQLRLALVLGKRIVPLQCSDYGGLLDSSRVHPELQRIPQWVIAADSFRSDPKPLAKQVLAACDVHGDAGRYHAWLLALSIAWKEDPTHAALLTDVELQVAQQYCKVTPSVPVDVESGGIDAFGAHATKGTFHVNQDTGEITIDPLVPPSTDTAPTANAVRVSMAVLHYVEASTQKAQRGCCAIL